MAVPGRARSCVVRLRKRLLAPTTDPAPYTFAMLSHPGRVRKSNEDTCAASPGAGAFVVCDGMGGAAAGEVASRLAADTFLGQMTPHDGGVAPGSPGAEARIYQAIDAANQAVYSNAQSPKFRGMGTTLVALLIEKQVETAARVPQKIGMPLVTTPDDARSPLSDPVTAQSNSKRYRVAQPTLTLSVAHVGDSRCYRFRDSELTLLTDDHSLVEEQVRNGEITPQQAAVSPLRHIITRAIGSMKAVEPKIQALKPQAGDLYLLASDGLTRELTDSNIQAIVRRAKPQNSKSRVDLNQLCRTLIDEANDHGGGDNITVLVVMIS